ncbi:bacteriocin-protection, YdeI or OmpD-associated-domain-containing protein [Stachybotrys elegans]|uniref:Bacteriocin-protection, YdeI or OmpD-associated-domain-containing protein n=1 Tax=Stachybotrys elegans TaxID=80388 RepID=A0A8K0SBQ2_9HYPO|nr:bacteriocin-protection, YdeI or OmpD-associated-domain-containing protein [Stachybotrys elegans]
MPRVRARTRSSALESDTKPKSSSSIAKKQSKPAVPATTSSDLPTIIFPSASAFEAWLVTNTSSSPGIWLQISKKGRPVPTTVTYDEALDVALCLGWIDGQRRARDADYFLQRFTPRRPASLWSRRNVDKVAVLVAQGRMRPEGQAAIDAAKADGRWDRAYAGSSTIQVPADLDAALSRNPEAKTFFESLTRAQRYSVLVRIETAKSVATRERRIAQSVEQLAQNKTSTSPKS